MGMWRERRAISAARFCPWCGVDSLMRHGNADKGKTSADDHRGVEFWCTTCGSSFKLDRSNRYRQAVELQTDHRRLRVNSAPLALLVSTPESHDPSETLES
jgi:hypothetical protein